MVNVNTPEYWNRVWKASGEGRRTVEVYTFGSSVLPSKGTVLDLGCGICAGTKILRLLGFDVVGVDFASEAKRAHERQFLLHDVQESLPFDDEGFDAVFAIMLIQCLNTPEAMIKEAYRMLKPSGRFLVASPGKHKWREDYYFTPTLKELGDLVSGYFTENTCLAFNYLAWRVVLATK